MKLPGNVTFDWESLEDKVKRAMRVPPEEKMRMLQESLEFFSEARRGCDGEENTPREPGII